MIECRKCKKTKDPARFVTSKQLEERICSYCVLKHAYILPKRKLLSDNVDCKCLRCAKIYKSNFPFGLCDACKRSDDYQNYEEGGTICE